MRFGERVYKVSVESGSTCPNRDGTVGRLGCSFCNLDSYNPATSREGIGEKEISEQLEVGIKYTRKRHGALRVIAYFQSGSNTHAPASALMPVFKTVLQHKSVVGLAISTRPDCISAEHVEMLSELAKIKMLWVELGLQSAHDSTLDRINRGHNSGQFAQAACSLKEANIMVCAHTILGLPGEDSAMMLETARFLNRLEVWGVKIHNLHVLKGTALEKTYNEGELYIPTLETYAIWVADFLEELDPKIIVHRINGHSPRSLTVAPEWSINKLAIFNAVEKELEKRNSFQGRKFAESARSES